MNKKNNIIINLLALAILCISTPAIANPNGLYTFGGLFAYNDSKGLASTYSDYAGISPNGYWGIKYLHNIDAALSMEVGLKHESSIPYREIGGGFNGFFVGFNLKLF